MKKNVFALFLSLAAFALLVGCGGGGGGSSSPTVGSLKLNIVDNNVIRFQARQSKLTRDKTETTSTHLRENVAAGKAFIKVSKPGIWQQ